MSGPKDPAVDQSLAALSAEVFDEMKPKLVERLSQSLADKLQWSLNDKVGDLVTEFYEAEVAPALSAELHSQKDEIVSAFRAHAASVGDVIAEAMVSKVEATLECDYDAEKVWKALFGESY